MVVMIGVKVTVAWEKMGGGNGVVDKGIEMTGGGGGTVVVV